MEKKRKEFEKSANYRHVVEFNPNYNSLLNARDWLELVLDSLKSCKSILKVVAEKNHRAKPLAGFLNCEVEGGDCSEKRITSKEVINTLPKKFQVNLDEWLLISVKVLHKTEKKGQFLERRLFIVADTATLLVTDIRFHKIPQPDQFSGIDLPKINEVVSGVSIKESGQTEDRDSFLELMIPYFHKTDLGKDIIRCHLEEVVDEIRELAKKAKDAREKAKLFIRIRDRLGIFNNLDP